MPKFTLAPYTGWVGEVGTRSLQGCPLVNCWILNDEEQICIRTYTVYGHTGRNKVIVNIVYSLFCYKKIVLRLKVYVGLGKMIRKETVVSNLEDIIRRVGVCGGMSVQDNSALSLYYMMRSVSVF